MKSLSPLSTLAPAAMSLAFIAHIVLLLAIQVIHCVRKKNGVGQQSTNAEAGGRRGGMHHIVTPETKLALEPVYSIAPGINLIITGACDPKLHVASERNKASVKHE